MRSTIPQCSPNAAPKMIQIQSAVDAHSPISKHIWLAASIGPDTWSWQAGRFQMRHGVSSVLETNTVYGIRNYHSMRMPCSAKARQQNRVAVKVHPLPEKAENHQTIRCSSRDTPISPPIRPGRMGGCNAGDDTQHSKDVLKSQQSD